jgi:O-antigen/teichoic acid export membrane protein
MISLKALFKSSLIYAIGTSIMRVMTFLLLPLYTNILDADGKMWYGNFVLVVTSIAFLRICYSHGIGDGFLKLYSKSKNQQTIISTYLTYILLVIIGISSIIWIINSIVPQQNTDNLIGLLQSQIKYIILIVMCDTVNFRIIDILRIKNYALYYMIGQLCGIITTLYLSIYFVKSKLMGLEGALLALLCGAIVTFIIFMPVLIKNLKFSEFSKSYLKQLISLGARFFPAAIFFMFMALLDRYLLKFLLVSPINNPEYVNNLIGTYSVGAKLASIPLFMINAFNLGWQPFYLSNGNTKQAHKKYESVGTIFIITTLSISWFVGIVIPTIANLNIPFSDTPLIGKTYSGFNEIIPIMLLAHIFYALYIINMPSIYLCDKQNWSPIFRLSGAISNILLNIILIPMYEIKGAAIATALSYGIMFLFLFYKNQQWMPIKIMWKDIILLTIIISISIIHFIGKLNMQYYLMIGTLIYICYLMYKHGIKNLISLFK